MSTKIFTKLPRDDWYLIDETINAALADGYDCFGQSTSFAITRDGHGEICAQCETPDELGVAVWLRKGITFSISLPRKYWK